MPRHRRRPDARRPVRRRPGRPATARRAGFTLVEMLISVTLVLLMMLMFAEIYSLAAGAVSTQKGMAENDQKARALATILRNDLQNRTFRSVYPFLPGDTGIALKQELLTLRQGYFSVSENHPDVDIDDALQLTVFAPAGVRFYGAAAPPPAAWAVTTNDHPEFDDGIAGNGAGASSAAEVSYFVRNGNLYRSVLLIREPYDPEGTDANPGSGTSTPDTESFWRDFAYSAFRDGQDKLQFHGYPESLDNAGGTTTTISLTPPYAFRLPLDLASPQIRFGHSFSLEGRPREYLVEKSEFADVTGTPPKSGFIGRYTAEERSSDAFDFPGQNRVPLDPARAWNDNDNDGIVDEFEGGSRRGIDLLLANVHGFDIEVWDDIVGDWVDLGHSRSGRNPYKSDNPTEPGFYSKSRHTSEYLKPAPNGDADWRGYFSESIARGTGNFGNRFDTWHHAARFVEETPPGSGTFVERGWAGPPPYLPTKPNLPPNSTSDAPVGPTIFGDEAIEAPLRAIRITVRYLDVNSGQMRQVTIEQSLVD